MMSDSLCYNFLLAVDADIVQHKVDVENSSQQLNIEDKAIQVCVF